MLRRVRDYIRENKMIEAGDVVLAGVSGGGDSMAMLAMLRELASELKMELCAVHVHHGIRGKEADRDALLVENCCENQDIRCITYHYDVPELSKQWKMGEEETGRMLRKEAFEKTAVKYRSAGRRVRIALAHNREDLAETMLHNLARGTGLRGLSTMRPVAGEIIRPLLCLGKEEIISYLETQGIPYILDSSNLSDEYTRNRIRHHILPAMTEINLRAAEHMAETAGRLAMAEDYLCKEGSRLLAAQRREKGRYLFSEEFHEAEKIIQIYALQQALEQLSGKRKDIQAVHLESVLELFEMENSKEVMLPYGLRAKKVYGGVLVGTAEAIVSKAVDIEDSWRIPVPGTVKCELGTAETRVFLYEGQKIEEKPYTKWLDYDRIKGNLCIRTRRAFDRIAINGEGGRKKLKAFMVDQKIPADMRGRIPIIACESGEEENEVLWIVGYRISANYKITPDTKHVLEIKYQGGNENE